MAALVKGGIYSIKSAVKSLINGPTTFHCMVCNTLLMIPRGSWRCQACTTTNEETTERCVQCAQDRYEQHILCGSCGKSTSIPKSGVLDSLRAGIVDLEEELHRSWLDLTGQPYVACPKCQHAVKLPSNLSATNVKCSNCLQSFRASPSTASVGNTGNRRYVKLSQTTPNTSQNEPLISTNQSKNSNDFKLTEALSNIDETTKEFSLAPTVNDSDAGGKELPSQEQPLGRIIYQPREKPERELDLVNSFANTS
jgi:LSD1 subclass zinc finger protein